MGGGSVLTHAVKLSLFSPCSMMPEIPPLKGTPLLDVLIPPPVLLHKGKNNT